MRDPLLTRPDRTAAAPRPHAAAHLAAAIAVAALLAVGTAGAATYKWIDDKGVVHYSDQVPPEAINKGNVKLNKQGVPIGKTEAALTPEQSKLRAAEEERQKQLAKEQDDQARRDRALLSSYTTESEIDLTKARALTTIDNVVKSMAAYGEQLNRRKAEIEARKRSYGDKPAPPVLDRELESIAGELARQQDVLAQKKREAESITAKYDADKRRWHELMLTKAGVAAAATAPAGGAAAAPAGAPAPATPAK